MTFPFVFIFLLKYLFLGILHVPIFFLNHQSYSSFPFVIPSCWFILISIPLLATCTVFISPVRITSRVPHDSLPKNPSFEMHFFIWWDEWCFRRHWLLTLSPTLEMLMIWPWSTLRRAPKCQFLHKVSVLSTQMTSLQMSGFRFSNFFPTFKLYCLQ